MFNYYYIILWKTMKITQKSLNVTSAPENVEKVVNEPIKVKKPKQLVQEEQEVPKVNIDVNPNKIPSPKDEPVKVDLTEDKEEVVEEKTEVEDTPEEKNRSRRNTCCTRNN